MSMNFKELTDKLKTVPALACTTLGGGNSWQQKIYYLTKYYNEEVYIPAFIVDERKETVYINHFRYHYDSMQFIGDTASYTDFEEFWKNHDSWIHTVDKEISAAVTEQLNHQRMITDMKKEKKEYAIRRAAVDWTT